MTEFNDRVNTRGFGTNPGLIHSLGGRSRTERINHAADRPVVASSADRPNHPGWYHNLRARPDITIETQRALSKSPLSDSMVSSTPRCGGASTLPPRPSHATRSPPDHRGCRSSGCNTANSKAAQPSPGHVKPLVRPRFKRRKTMRVSGIVGVVGATGQQGGAVARALLSAGVTVRALVRDTTKSAAQALAAAGAQLVIADFDDPKTLRAAFDGVSRVFAMTTMDSGRGTSGETADGIVIADAAQAASVEHLVYSSVGGAERHTGIPHFESKRRVEEHIESLGIPATFVRPTFFYKNLLGQPPTPEDGVIVVRLPLPTAFRFKWWPLTTSALSRRR